MAKKGKETDDELEVDEELEDDAVAIAYDVATYPSDLTLSGVYQMWQSGDIIIPDYQRNFIWSQKQASLLIESFLIGLPVPPVFLYIEEDNKSQVIDGQQRLTSIAYYMDGFFGTENKGKKQVFRLVGLSDKSPFAKKSFVELEEAHQRKLKNAVLRAMNIRQLNPKGAPTSAYHIFERLNTGGTALKPQEIRNCVYHGEFVGVLRALNTHPSWRKIVGKVTNDKHQKDVELILRIFSLTNFFDSYEKPMKEFLGKRMKEHRRATSAEVAMFKIDFLAMADRIFDTLGERPFHLRGRLNSSALDSVFATLINAKNNLPKDLAARFEALKGDSAFTMTTILSTSDNSVLQKRFALAKEFLID